MKPCPAPADALWHRHVQRAAVELRQARVRAVEAEIPPRTVAAILEAELARLELRATRER